jgi:hypothetical protein
MDTIEGTDDPAFSITVGFVGWLASWTLADVHMAFATTAAVLTCVYMGIAIWKKIKE